MKTILFRSVVLISLMSILVTPAFAHTQANPLVVDLLAGQHEVAGSIKVWDDGASLYVLYETTGPWCLTETHLAIASSLGGIPQANGNPMPGQFPYKNSHGCNTNYLYKVPLDKNACELYVAAHAVVKRPGSTETAWGNGFDFPGKNWATYFTYKTEACSVTPSPTWTPTSIPTNTSTGVPPTATPTNTPTDTSPTNTPTNTATSTPTDTSPTNTPTNTATNTPTGTSPTNTPTNTPTPTSPPSTCEPVVVAADFSRVAVGQSVEGMGVVASNLNIDAANTAIKILTNTDPMMYVSSLGGVRIKNGYLAAGGGFSSTAKESGEPHLYTFTFASGVSVNNLSLRMLDFGDINPSLTTDHLVTMTSYDVNDAVVSSQQLSYTTLAELFPQSSNIYGNLQVNGDASAPLGQPGKWMWSVSGDGITKVVLEFGVGHDPNIGFDTLSYSIDCDTETNQSELGFRLMSDQQHVRRAVD
ncbi:MAG TPA: hypothetical protein VK851_07770 [Anaerolineales bacterium]|nr:hypothetical protein [Anaerolineales bacterium]